MMGERWIVVFSGALGVVAATATGAEAEPGGVESHRFAVVAQGSGIRADVRNRLEAALDGLMGELQGAETIAPKLVQEALADARTETNQKCSIGKLDSRCQISLGKRVAANYVAQLDVTKSGKTCDVKLSVFSIAEETQKAAAIETAASCDPDALVRGLRAMVAKVGSKLGLGGSGATVVLDDERGAPQAETEFDRQLRRAKEKEKELDLAWTALVKELDRLPTERRKAKLESYLELAGEGGPHADEAKERLGELRSGEAASRLVALRASFRKASMEDKRKLVEAFAASYAGTSAARDAEGMLAEAERAEAEREAEARRAEEAARRAEEAKKSRGGVRLDWVHSTRAKVELTRSEVTVAQYAACVGDGGACSAHHLDGYEWPGQAFTASEYCNWPKRGERSDHPINCVTAEDADRFCRWAGGRLPTEEEW